MGGRQKRCAEICAPNPAEYCAAAARTHHRRHDRAARLVVLEQADHRRAEGRIIPAKLNCSADSAASHDAGSARPVAFLPPRRRRSRQRLDVEDVGREQVGDLLGHDVHDGAVDEPRDRQPRLDHPARPHVLAVVVRRAVAVGPSSMSNLASLAGWPAPCWARRTAWARAASAGLGGGGGSRGHLRQSRAVKFLRRRLSASASKSSRCESSRQRGGARGARGHNLCGGRFAPSSPRPRRRPCSQDREACCCSRRCCRAPRTRRRSATARSPSAWSATTSPSYAGAYSGGTYVDNPPSCSWNSTNQSLVIAANVTVRDRPSNSGCDKAGRAARARAGSPSTSRTASRSRAARAWRRQRPPVVELGRIVVERGARVEADGMGRCGAAWQSLCNSQRLTGIRGAGGGHGASGGTCQGASEHPPGSATGHATEPDFVPDDSDPCSVEPVWAYGGGTYYYSSSNQCCGGGLVTLNATAGVEVDGELSADGQRACKKCSAPPSPPPHDVLSPAPPPPPPRKSSVRAPAALRHVAVPRHGRRGRRHGARRDGRQRRVNGTGTVRARGAAAAPDPSQYHPTSSFAGGGGGRVELPQRGLTVDVRGGGGCRAAAPAPFLPRKASSTSTTR